VTTKNATHKNCILSHAKKNSLLPNVFLNGALINGSKQTNIQTNDGCLFSSANNCQGQQQTLQSVSVVGAEIFA